MMEVEGEEVVVVLGCPEIHCSGRFQDLLVIRSVLMAFVYHQTAPVPQSVC